MGKNKARHILHGVLDCLPIILIPIFMIYSQNHEINDNTLQVQENKVVDFNQQVNITYTNVTYSYATITPFDDGVKLSITDYSNANRTIALTPSASQYFVNMIRNHKYYISLVNSYSYITSIYDGWSGHNYNNPSIFNANATKFYFNVNINNLQSNQDFIFYPMLIDLTQMYGEGNEPTNVIDFNTQIPNQYYPYTESEEVVIENYETITYNDTDIMSQSFYCLYNAVDKYFNMGNVFGMHNLYNWFEVNIFGGTASPSIYIVWNIVLYEFIMDLLFLLYGLFMFFIDLCKRLIDKPLNSIK